ncbi:hypothetical protein BH10ACT7_BH10ACT7_15200 [soil metagenome]
MKTSPLRAIITVTIAVLALTACSTLTAPVVENEAMTVEEAGAYYLETVCPANEVGEALGAAYTAQDLPAFTAAAEVARDAYKESGLRFADETVVWPEAVAADILILRDASIALATSYQTLSEVTTLQEADAVVFPTSADSAEASSRIRDALGLSSDPAVSCP